MKIQTRMSMLLSILLLLSIVFVGVIQGVLQKQRDIYRNAILRQNTTTIETILDLGTRATSRTVSDYSHWDDMVTFVKTRDREWGLYNVDTIIADFKIDHVWVCDKNLKTVYSAHNTEKKKIAAVPVPGDRLAAAFANRKDHHFFMIADGLLLEIAGSRITATIDLEQKTTYGYLFICRHWDAAYVKQLEEMTHDRVSYTPLPGPQRAVEHDETMVVVTRLLNDIAGTPVAAMHFTQKNPEIGDIRSLSRTISIIVVLSSVILFFIFLFTVRHWIIAPLRVISEALDAENIAGLARLGDGGGEGKNEFQVIGDLIRTSLQNKKELESLHAVIGKDMEMAVNVQTSFLPNMDALPKEHQEWDVAFLYKPMTDVSGDFYDFYIEKKKLRGVGLYDVSGHGIASALITMIARSIISRCFMKKPERKLGTVIAEASRIIQQEISNANYYVTGVIMRFSHNRVEYVNAGHPDCFLKTKNGVKPLRKANDDKLHGFFLGIEGHREKYDILQFKVARNDYLLLSSDCLGEGRDAAGEQYGTTRIMHAFQEAPGETADEVLQFIYNDFLQFTGGQSRLNDDLTIIVLKKR